MSVDWCDPRIHGGVFLCVRKDDADQQFVGLLSNDGGVSLIRFEIENGIQSSEIGDLPPQTEDWFRENFRVTHWLWGRPNCDVVGEIEPRADLLTAAIHAYDTLQRQTRQLTAERFGAELQRLKTSPAYLSAVERVDAVREAIRRFDCRFNE